MEIPGVMNKWIAVMPKAALDAEGRKTALALSEALQELGALMVDILRLNAVPYSAETIARLQPAIHHWRDALEELAGSLRDRPEDLPSTEGLDAALQAHLARVQAEARQALNDHTEQHHPDRARTLVQELSLYRGLSQAMISATRSANALNWAQLRETRF